jgi:tRNA nucleotidyltransferase (CCA-adding enzyme)
LKVILTHNHADFDAVASLLAMHILEPDAVPVLPSQVNSNVTQFLLLYGRNWPIIPPEDLALQREKVDLAYVVDTQSFDMVRGMSAETPLHIIDHHPQDRDLPSGASIEGEPTGANVTLLIEKITVRGIVIDNLEATLFLLGISEDTGHFQFKSTTARDLRAAAWLMEQNADLDTVREFTQHAMNVVQSSLFHRLQESAITLKVNSHDIVVTSASVPTQIRESATIARELLEVLGCDALFLVMQIGDDVQIIARSTNDNVDVADIVREFAGNGHPRAAAAFLRDADLNIILNRLIDVLPQHTQPSVRVEALMSWGVQTIASSATVAEAHAIMLESGHEGYPVIAHGVLVGLLTRRSVDRAVLHNLQKLRVTEVMDAGQHALRPSDSIDLLKERMLATGWGQIPVTDEDGLLLGIVTRTDLIKHWGQPPQEADHHQQIVDTMRAMFAPGVWAMLQAISQTAQAQNKGLFLVGGIVRDLLLERPNLDIDLVVEGDAIELAKTLADDYGGSIQQHKQFGTAKWKLDEHIGFDWDAAAFPQAIDFATSRAEFYEAPSALPTVRSGSIKLDLHRRDFSINALAIRLSPAPMGHLLDFYNGERDLREGVVRVLHSLSFIDDPTRMLRAARFEQRFGFQIEARTEELIRGALDLLKRVSGDRLRHEFNLILAEAHPLPMLERLGDLGVLENIHSGLKIGPQVREYFAALDGLRQNSPWPLPDDFDDWRVLAFSFLILDYDESMLNDLGKRLTLSRQSLDQLRAVKAGYTLRDDVGAMTPAEVVHHLEGLGMTAWLACWVLYEDLARHNLEKLVTEWQYIHPTLKGDDLLAMGLRPGPDVGQLLDEIRSAWLNGEVKNGHEERVFAEGRIRQLTAQS